jgi:menaquinone-dependent protoporphyrinogen IX oxidase
VSTLVAYYSNTGNTRRVAELLARELDADLAEVTCERYLRWYGPVAMAWDIFTRTVPKVTVVAGPNGRYDRVVIGGPVWAAKAAPPVLALSSHWQGTPRALFVTCSGASQNSPPEPAVREMQNALAGGQDVPSRIFREAEIRSERLGELARAFAADIRAAASVNPTAAPK